MTIDLEILADMLTIELYLALSGLLFCLVTFLIFAVSGIMLYLSHYFEGLDATGNCIIIWYIEKTKNIAKFFGIDWDKI